NASHSQDLAGRGPGGAASSTNAGAPAEPKRLDQLARKTLGRLLPQGASTRSVTEEEFKRNLLLVDSLRRQGRDAEGIARETALSAPEVRAYLRALDRIDKPAMNTLK